MCARRETCYLNRQTFELSVTCFLRSARGALVDSNEVAAIFDYSLEPVHDYEIRRHNQQDIKVKEMTLLQVSTHIGCSVWFANYRRAH